MEDKVLRLVFTIFVGAILALFIGFGIHTFYPPPASPDLGGLELKQNPTNEEVARIAAAQKAHQAAIEAYSRRVSVVSMGASVLLLRGSLLLGQRNQVMANGSLLGGLFTLVYGVGRGFASRDTTTLFIALTVALAIVLFLGFRRFHHPHEPSVEGQRSGGPSAR
jgi:hypothetical protein